MRKNLFVGASAILLIAGAANAQFNLGSLSPAAPDVAVSFTVVDPPNNNQIIGFDFQYDFAETPNDASWASDLQLCLTPPGGTQICYGGFGGDAPVSAAFWPFDGPASDAAGHYGASFSPWAAAPAPKGQWTITVENDWDTDPGNTHFNNMVLTFIKTPEPATLGMLAIGGLALLRRRR